MGTDSKKICKVTSKGRSTTQEIKIVPLMNHIRRERDAPPPSSCHSSGQELAYQRPSWEAEVAFDEHILDLV